MNFQKVLNILAVFLILLCIIGCKSNMALAEEEIKTFQILSLGDSYTIGESVAENGRWPVQLKENIEAKNEVQTDLSIIAKTGWRTDDLRETVNGTELDDKYDLVTLLIGVNNQYQNKPIEYYPQEFRLCLEQAISFAKSRKDVVVISIPDYAFTPFGEKKNPEKISKEIDEYNAINKRISHEYGVKYVFITDITRRGLNEPELVANDGLHPSAKCYSLFVPRILEAIDQ